MSDTTSGSSASRGERSRLFFICIPRSGSTSLLKCLSSGIGGIEAWFEPYVIAKIAAREYKKHTGEDLPRDWAEEHTEKFDKVSQYVHEQSKLPIVPGKNYAYSEVKRELENLESRQVVVKDMGGSFFGDLKKYLPSADSGYKYIFIIRDPQAAMSSYRRASVGTALKREGLGYEKDLTEENFDLHKDDPYYYQPGGNYYNIHAAWQYVRENLDPNPLIVDCADLMSNPKPVMQKICEFAGLEYHDGILSWDASTDIAKTWKNPAGIPQMLGNSLSFFHQTALHSTCFHGGKKEKPPLSSETKDIQKAVADGTKYYEEMYALRFKP